MLKNVTGYASSKPPVLIKKEKNTPQFIKPQRSHLASSIISRHTTISTQRNMWTVDIRTLLLRGEPIHRLQDMTSPRTYLGDRFTCYLYSLALRVLCVCLGHDTEEPLLWLIPWNVLDAAVLHIHIHIQSSQPPSPLREILLPLSTQAYLKTLETSASPG